MPVTQYFFLIFPLIIDVFLFIYEFLNRIFEFICIGYPNDAFVILDPSYTILISTAFFIFSKDGPFHYFSLKYFNFPFFS